MRAFLPSTSPMPSGGLAPDRGVALGQQVERLGLGQFLAAEREAQIGDGLVEEPRPGGAAGDVFLVQQLLDVVRQLVRAEGADVAQPRPIMGERRIGGLRFELGVFEAVDLEGEEQERRRDRVDLLLHRLEEAADFRVGNVAGMDERGVAHDPAALFLQPLVFRDGAPEGCTRQLGQTPLIPRAKGFGFLGEPDEVACQRLALGTGIEVGKVPFRQRPERRLSFRHRRLHLRHHILDPLASARIWARRRGITAGSRASDGAINFKTISVTPAEKLGSRAAIRVGGPLDCRFRATDE